MLKNGQIYFKNLVVFTRQNFKSMFGHFLRLCIKGLTQCYHRIETGHLICISNQLTGLSMMGKLTIKIDLNKSSLFD